MIRAISKAKAFSLPNILAWADGPGIWHTKHLAHPVRACEKRHQAELNPGLLRKLSDYELALLIWIVFDLPPWTLLADFDACGWTASGFSYVCVT